MSGICLSLFLFILTIFLHVKHQTLNNEFSVGDRLIFIFSSDYGFKLSEDLSLEVCVPDPEFSGSPYTPPVPCPVGTTYRRSKG